MKKLEAIIKPFKLEEVKRGAARARARVTTLNSGPPPDPLQSPYAPRDPGQGRLVGGNHCFTRPQCAGPATIQARAGRAQPRAGAWIVSPVPTTSVGRSC
jgi:hypothetical protein